jgi:hypothetical protein
MDYSRVLQFNGDTLILQFHQESGDEVEEIVNKLLVIKFQRIHVTYLTSFILKVIAPWLP